MSKVTCDLSGDEPPYGGPVFVLTRHPREPLVVGATIFHFVVDGFAAALAAARAAADDRSDRRGSSTANQFLAAGPIEELHMHIAPVVLGTGERAIVNTCG